MPDRLARAAEALAQGALVVYPTDTLYGLGARALDAGAVERVVEAKRRPPGQPLSLAFSSLEEIEPWAELSPERRAWLRTHLPGPWTALLPPSARARRSFAPGLLGPGRKLGVRVPPHPVARELARRVGPITATSANRHGEPPAQSLREARRAFGRAVAVYVDGPPPPSGRPSTLIDLTRGTPRVRRRR